jgi:hypothetical protein
MLVALLTTGATRPAAAIDQGGSVEGVADGYREGEPGFQGWFRAIYALDVAPKHWVFFKVAGIFELDTHGEIRRDALYDETDRDLARAPLRFRDLLVGFRAGATTIALGRQRLTWKRASFINATDNLVPRDWTDPLDEARLSPWALDVTYERDRFSLEGALVPRYAPSRLPQLGNRWLDIAPPGVDLEWGDADFPPLSWDTLQAAVRGGYRGQHGEVRLSYFRGFDDAPRVALNGTLLDRSFVEVSVAGIDCEVLAGPFIFRAEAGYFHFLSPDDGYALYEIEGEWSRSPWRVVLAIADAVGGDPGSVAPAALDLAFLPSAFIHIERGEATEWQVALDASVGTNEFDSFVRVSGSYPFAGHVRVGGDVSVLSGDPDGWGRWDANDRLRVFLRFDY